MTTEMSNTIKILEPHLKKVEKAYGQALRFDDNDSKKYGYVIGEGGIIISVSERTGALTILVFETMSLKDANGYLTYQGSPQTSGGFVYKMPEDVQEILAKLCDILLETPVAAIDAKIIKQKVMEAEFACQQKYHPISEQAMQSMRFEAERAELNMSLKKR